MKEGIVLREEEIEVVNTRIKELRR